MVGSASRADDPAGGLEGIRSALAAGNPDLYRHVALYLQVLRSVLPGRVEQACFHLATQVHVQRYLRLPAAQRRHLHRLLRERLNRCCSLLTVEQLVCLARRLDLEKRQRQQHQQRQLVQRMLQPAGGPQQIADSVAPGPQLTKPADPSAPLPPGSVRLGLSPPLDAAAFDWSRFLGGVGDSPGSPLPGQEGDLETIGERDLHAADRPDRARGDTGTQAGAAQLQDGVAGLDAQGDGQADDDGAAQLSDPAAAALMAALMEGLLDADADSDADSDADGDAADPAHGADAESTTPGSDGSASGQEPTAAAPGPWTHALSGDAAAAGPRRHRRAQAMVAGEQPSGRQRESSASQEDALLVDAELSPAGPSAADAASPWDEAGLPQDPILLLQWLDGLEEALARRLRNLSHAINVDLLRLGLSRGLLPISLLEAVLQGQIETLASPANVLRLQLPFGLSPGAPPLQAVAILLRPVDLEMEEPRLRTCRRRILQHRQQVRKMAQNYRRLQRRLQAHEAERLWLQDIRASSSTET